MYRPLTPGDIELMKTHKDTWGCTVPVREDHAMADGHVIPGLLCWGHPSAYEIRIHGSRIYAVRKWEETPELGPEVARD